MAGRNGLLVFRDAVLVSEFLSNEIVEFVFTDPLLKPRTNPNSCQNVAVDDSNGRWGPLRDYRIIST